MKHSTYFLVGVILCLFYNHNTRLHATTHLNSEFLKALKQISHLTGAIELTEKNLNLLDDHNKPIVIDIGASWCPPCQELKPIYNAVAQELTDYIFFKTENEKLIKSIKTKLNITIEYYPTLIFIKNSKITKPNNFPRNKKDLKKFIEESFK